jgi:Flp pilus assembly protein TadD
MLSYEQGDLENASACFLRAVTVEPDNSVAHFNLGSVLDELAQLELARQHLRVAVRLDPRYADAHYNLAFVCDKLGSSIEARQHWQQYIHLDPGSPWCDYARQRLAMPLP